MQQWLAKSVVISMDEGGANSTGTLMSYDEWTFTVQETGGVVTYPQHRFWSIKAAA